jgi:hypothetical protein
VLPSLAEATRKLPQQAQPGPVLDNLYNGNIA